MGAYAGPPRTHPFFCYLDARDRAHSRDEAFRVYVAESLRLAPQGRALTKPYTGVLASLMEMPDTRTGEEIAADVITRLGLGVTE